MCMERDGLGGFELVVVAFAGVVLVALMCGVGAVPGVSRTLRALDSSAQTGADRAESG